MKHITQFCPSIRSILICRSSDSILFPSMRLIMIRLRNGNQLHISATLHGHNMFILILFYFCILLYFRIPHFCLHVVSVSDLFSDISQCDKNVYSDAESSYSDKNRAINRQTNPSPTDNGGS